MMRQRLHGLAVAHGFCLGVAALLAAPPAGAQSGLQTPPDGTTTLINKRVGNEQWAISLSPERAAVTGNVFRSDGGPPTFVWCRRTGDDGGTDPRTVQITFACEGADGCAVAPCNPTAWQHVAEVTLPGEFFLPARDPFSPLRSSAAFCDPAAITYELIGGEPSLQISTQGCNYVTAWQPSLTSVKAGDELFVRLWHFSLTAPAPATAHVAIQIGDEILWQDHVAIPSPAGLITSPIAVTRDLPAGTPVYFHLRNHGENSYNLLQISQGELGPTLVNPAAWTLASDGVPLPPR